MFAVGHECGDARTGVLTTPSGELKTPGMLIRTSRGLPVNLTPDHLAMLRPDGQALYLCALQYMDNPKPEAVQAGGGLHKFLGMEGYTLVMGLRDSVTFECGVRNASRKDVVVNTPQGNTKVTPEAYVDLAAALQPDILLALADEMVAESISGKRARTQVDNTLGYLDAMLARKAAAGLRAAVLGAVVGAGDGEQWARAAEEVAKRGVDGVILSGLGLGEDPDTRPGLLRAAATAVPRGQVRALQGLDSPLDVLMAVEAGCDIFEGAFLQQVTDGGCALVFPVEEGAGEAGGAGGAGGYKQDPCKLNLRSVGFAKDARPLLPGCQCLACRQHSRAYIHHLLNAHEMTGEVLLESHNTHHYLRFFAAVRAAIEGGRLEGYRRWLQGVLDPPPDIG